MRYQTYGTGSSGPSMSIDVGGFGNFQLVDMILQAVTSGKTVNWEIGEGGSIECKPQFWNGRIYFGACDKNFYCLDDKGRELWRFATKGPICGNATVTGDAVYFGSYDNTFYALGHEGNLLWKFSTTGKIFSKPLVVDDRIYFGSQDKNLYAVNSDGEKQWTFRTKGPVSSGAAYGNGVIYFGSYDYNLYAIDERGRLLWTFPTKGEILAWISYQNGVVYFSSFDKNLYAVDAGNGQLIWTYPTNSPQDNGQLVTKDAVYLGGRDGVMHAVSLGGNRLWTITANEWLAIGSDIGNGLLFFGSNDNNLYAVNAKTGDLKWKFNTKSLVVGTPTVVGEKIIFGSWDGNLYALSMDGNVLWNFHTSISTPAPFHTDNPYEVKETFKFTWQQEAASEKEDRYASKGSSMGEGLSLYGTGDAGYMGSRKEYVGKKKGYR